MNQLSDPIQLKAPSCQSNSTHGILNCLKTNFILSLHTSNPSLHSLQPQVLSTTTSESGSDPELEPLATSERSSRKASMSVSCSESHISEMPTSFKSNCKNPSKTIQKPTGSGNIQIPQGIFVSFSLNPRRCAKSLTFPASTASLRQSFTTRCCERRRRWKSRTSSCWMWSCLWSLGLWTGKRSLILNSVCHV